MVQGGKKKSTKKWHGPFLGRTNKLGGKYVRESKVPSCVAGGERVGRTGGGKLHEKRAITGGAKKNFRGGEDNGSRENKFTSICPGKEAGTQFKRRSVPAGKKKKFLEWGGKGIKPGSKKGGESQRIDWRWTEGKVIERKNPQQRGGEEK